MKTITHRTAKSLPLPMTALLMLALLLLAAAAQAAEPAPPTGSATQAWLDLQIGGTAAPADERPMPGEIADKVYKRYVESFDEPIPQTLKRDNFVSSGSDGG
ncbi:MAG TPA: DUF3613 domain-containing protein [Fontimonas sp.]